MLSIIHRAARTCAGDSLHGGQQQQVTYLLASGTSAKISPALKRQAVVGSDISGRSPDILGVLFRDQPGKVCFGCH